MGTKRLLELLNKITDGKGTMEDLDKITELAEFIKSNSSQWPGPDSPEPRPLHTCATSATNMWSTSSSAARRACKALLNYKIDPGRVYVRARRTRLGAPGGNSNT